MREIIAKMTETYKDIYSKQFEEMFKNYFDTPQYINLFRKQYYSILKNAISIDSLLKVQNIEDAYTIFRKYIETYILMFCVVSHPDIASLFLTHDKWLNIKAQGTGGPELRDFYRNKPDGYLQYGYIEKYVDTTAEDFRYSIRSVAEVSDIVAYYEWYRISNNFVHNNTTGLSVDAGVGGVKIKQMIKESQDHFVDFLKTIIKKLSVGLI